MLFLTVKEFSKLVNNLRSYCKRFDTTFFWDSVHDTLLVNRT